MKISNIKKKAASRPKHTPKPHSFEPTLLLGTGWHAYKTCESDEEGLNCNARIAMKNSEILIINPTKSTIKTGLDIGL